MATSFSKVQHEALEDGFLDLMGESKSDFTKVKLNDTVSTLRQLAAQYIAKINEKANQRDVSSSGKMQDEIKPTEVTIDGDVYTIGILAPDYASYQDEGVDGWAKNRGSRFKFKTKGVLAGSDMVKSIEAWLKREGGSARNVKSYKDKNGVTQTGISARKGETRRKYNRYDTGGDDYGLHD